MRDIDNIYTKRGTPVIVVIFRVAFIIYFIFSFFTASSNTLIKYQIEFVWVFYLLILYIAVEKLYTTYKQRGIDLTFALPLLFAVYCLHLVSMLLSAQDKLPLLNRAEHFASFVLIGYMVWIFFLKYLPQKVWHKHPYYTALLVLSVTSTLGVGNELVELLLDSLFNTTLIGNKLDTSLDLLMNTLGAGTFLAVRLIIGTTEDRETIH